MIDNQYDPYVDEVDEAVIGDVLLSEVELACLPRGFPLGDLVVVGTDITEQDLLEVLVQVRGDFGVAEDAVTCGQEETSDFSHARKGG